MLAESVSGYLLNWRLYSPSEKDEPENKHKLLKVVMYLTNNYLEKGHHIYRQILYKPNNSKLLILEWNKNLWNCFIKQVKINRRNKKKYPN